MASLVRNSETSAAQDGPAAFSERRFESSWVNAAVNCGLAGVFGFFVMCLILGWEKKIFAAGVGAFIFCFYSARYLWRTPREIRISERGITLVRRNGTETSLPWDRIEKVVAGGTCEDIYLLESADGPVQFSDDGYSVTRWEDLTNEIKRIAKARGIPFEKREYRKKKGAAGLMRQSGNTKSEE